MRFSRTLLALPAVLACAAAVGCNSPQHVKYEPDGTATAVEAPEYKGPVAHETPAPAVEVQPAPAPVKEAAPKPAPAPVVKEAAPKPAPAPVVKEAPLAAKPEVKTHVVAKGDTLQKISQKYYGTTKKWTAIMKANNMKDDKIRVGQKLVIPEAK